MRKVATLTLFALLLCACGGRPSKESREQLQQLVRGYNQERENFTARMDSIEADAASEAAARRKALLND